MTGPLFKAFGIAIALATIVAAYKPSDIQCGHKFQAQFVHNNYAYNAPSHEVADIVRSFFNIEWYVSIVSFLPTPSDPLLYTERYRRECYHRQRPRRRS